LYPSIQFIVGKVLFAILYITFQSTYRNSMCQI